jgi:hypothetical protein
MEGGVMQARTFRDIDYFDAGVRQLRQYLALLQGGSSPPRKLRSGRRIRKVTH